MIASITDVPRLSPSQADASECMHFWGLRYLDKIEVPPSQANIDGARIHAALEKYYRTGALPGADPDGRVVMEALVLLPKYHKGLSPEMAFFDVMFAGAWFGSRREGREMKADLVDLRDPRKPRLYDLKTTSDLKWVKAKEELEVNVQAAVYCRALFERCPEAEEIQCSWVYVTRPTKSRPHPKTRSVDFWMTREMVARVEKAWHNRITQLIKNYIDRPSVDSLPKNTELCGKYGGCGYGPNKLNICKQTTRERLGAIMGSGPTLKDEVSQLLANAKSTATAGPKTAPPVAAPKPGPVGLTTPKPPLSEPPKVAAVAKAPAPLVPAAKVFAGFKKPAPPPAAPVYEPATFVLPNDGEGVPLTEDARVPYLAWCVENEQNPLEHLGAVASPEFMVEVQILLDAALLDVVSATTEGEEAAFEEANAASLADAIDAPAASGDMDSVSWGAELEPKRRGRPAGSKNKTGSSVTFNMTDEVCEKLIQVLSKLLNENS